LFLSLLDAEERKGFERMVDKIETVDFEGLKQVTMTRRGT
jgi:hypothetical protein